MDNNRPFYMKSLESSSVESPIIEEKEEKDNNRPFYMKEADTSVVSQPSIDEPTALRKAQYGAAQETYLLGDIGRLTYAAFSPKTIQQ